MPYTRLILISTLIAFKFPELPATLLLIPKILFLALGLQGKTIAFAAGLIAIKSVVLKTTMVTQLLKDQAVLDKQTNNNN